jgi:hypothetical protein
MSGADTAASEQVNPDCLKLAPMFVALNALKKSADLCKVIGPLKGGTIVCGDLGYGDEVDRRALCALFCCCKNNGNQKCVAKVLWAADKASGYTNGYFKAETPYDASGNPIMSKNEPTRPTRGRSGGSRIPDVVVVQDPAFPPDQSNIEKVYEMKFPGDSYSTDTGPDDMTQAQAYDKLFGNKIDTNDPMTEENCNCDKNDSENQAVLDKAAAWEKNKDSLFNRIGATADNAASALGKAVSSAPSPAPGTTAAGAGVGLAAFLAWLLAF